MLEKKEIQSFKQMLDKLDNNQAEATMYYLFDNLDNKHKSEIWNNFRFNKEDFRNHLKNM